MSHPWRRSAIVAGLACLAVLELFGCAPQLARTPLTQQGPLRIREVADAGDPQRRASTRLVLEGLAAKDPGQALSHYERAIRTDATNPYAYLALAAYEIQWGDLDRGRQALRQAELLLESEHLDSPRVAPHLDGLRGRAALRAAAASGMKPEGADLLERARRDAPAVWGDGWLTADELR